MRRAGFVLPLLLPLLVGAGAWLGGAWNFLTVLVVLGLLPLVDALVGDDPRPIVTRGSAAAWFDGVLYAWVPLQLALLAFGVHVAAVAQDPATLLGLTASVGVLTGGVGITVAHELGHRLGRVPRGFACLLLATVAYAHFHIEHNKGHHARVATPDDPASARRGESFWRFLPRTLVGSFAGAWRIERARLAALGHGAWSPANRVTWMVAAPLALWVAVGFALGPFAAAFLVGQAAIAVLLLELVNYVEHYGLERARLPDGRYERVRPAHSWNSSRLVTNWYLFNLQRHSHHHSQVTARYQALEHRPDAPQLPAGYAAMILVALVPAVWRRLMDPRLDEWRDAAPAAGQP